MARGPTFTSYIRSELDPSAGVAYRQLESIANRTYDNIAKHAASTRAAEAQIGSGIGSGVVAQYERLANSQSRMARVANDNAAAQRSGGAAMREAAGASQLLERNLDTLATTLNVVQGPLGPIAGRVRALSGAFTQLTGLRFGLAAASASVVAFLAAANNFEQVRGKLAPLYDTQQDVNKALTQAITIANNARAPLSAVVDLYSKLTQAGRDYGISQTQISRITETATKAVALSGGTAETRAAAIYQFSQALASNRLGGDELRSILEGAPQLARAIADGLNKVKGFEGTTLGDLRNLGTQGKLTANVIAEALGNAASGVDAKFAKLPHTLSQASTAFKNQFQELVGGLDQSLGATDKLATSLIFIADHLRTVVALGAGLGAAFVVPKLGSFLTELKDAADKTAQLRGAEAAGNLSILRTGRAGQAQRAAGFAQLGVETAQQQEGEARLAVAQTLARIEALKEEQAQYQGGIAKAREQLAAAQAAASAQATGATLTTKALAEEARQAGLTAEQFAAITAADREATAAAVAGAEQRVAALRAEAEQVAANAALYQKRFEDSVAAKAARNTLNQSAGGGAFVPLQGAEQAALENQGNAYRSANALKKEAAALDAALTAAERELAAARLADAAASERQAAAQASIGLTGATDEVVRQSTVLTTYRQRERAVTDELRAAEAALAVEERAVGVASAARAAQMEAATIATRAAAVATSALATAGKFLLASLPILAITAAVTAVTYLATAEDQATRSAKDLAESQSTLGNFVDLTTGKIKEQNKALLANRLAQQNATVQSTTGAYATARQVLLNAAAPSRTETVYTAGGSISRTSGTGVPREVTEAAQALANGERGASARLNAALDKFSKTNAEAAQNIRDASTQLIGSAQNLTAATAGRRLLSGTGRTGDVQRAQGDFTGGLAASKPAVTALTQAQVEANAKLAASMNDVQKAQAALQKVRADADAYQHAHGGALPEGYAEQYQRAYEALQQAKEAQKAHTASVRDASKAEREHVKDLRAADEEERRTARDQAAENLNTSMQALENRAPTLSRQDYLDARIAILKTYDDELNKIDDTRAASHRAADQALSDRREVASIDREITKGYDDQVAVQALQIQGRNTEAEALRRTLEYQERIGNAALDYYPILLQQAREQQVINDQLADRQRLVDAVMGAVEGEREDLMRFFQDLPTRGTKAFGDLVKSAIQRFANIQLTGLVNKLFAGADEKVRALLEGRSKTDVAIAGFNSDIGKAGNSSARLASAMEAAASRINAVKFGAPAGTEAPAADKLASTTSDLSKSLDKVGSALEPAGGKSLTASADAIYAKFGAADSPLSSALGIGKPATQSTARSAYNLLGSQIGSNIDKSLTKLFHPSQAAAQEAGGLTPTTASGFFTKLGGSLGTALGGAATGAAVNSLLSPIGKALGVKTSQTGAEIGGAIGSVLPIPGGQFIGSVIGSITGGLLKKTKYGASTLQVDGSGNVVAGDAFGNSGSAKKAATQEANTVAQALNQISDALGATISNIGTITVGQRHGDYRVNVGGTSLKKAKGAKDFNDDAEAAAAYAIQAALSQGFIKGVSQASVNILKSGQDLQTAIQKATTIENIPKQLLAMTDPVRAAVENLNKQYENTIAILKEGGATAEQFAQAQKLYELQREQAIKAAAEQAYGAIDDLLTSLTSGSDSPLNKAQTLTNARSALSPLSAQVQAGKVVDQNDLVTAVQNMLNASRSRNGSSVDYFADYDAALALLNKAKQNATSGASLPGSPFDTGTASGSSVQSAISSAGANQVNAINQQTQYLGDRLQEIRDILSASNDNLGSAAGRRNSLGLLASFRVAV